MKKLNIFGISYFIIHLITEIVSFYILGNYMKNELFFLIVLIFDFIAFVPQGVIGFELRTKHITLIGLLLTALSLVLLYLKIEPIINIIILSIGNAMIHIDGAEKTLRSSQVKCLQSQYLFPEVHLD